MGVEMGEFAEFDLDRSLARAWSRFQARLADHLAGMEDDDQLLVEAESSVEDDDAGAAPYVQFIAWGEDMLRAEVSSDHYLASEHLLEEAGQEALTGLGFEAPTHAPEEPDGSGSANFFIDEHRTEADRLAVMGVRALRDVFGVTHPAFLSADNLAEDAQEPADLGVRTPQAATEPLEGEPVAVYPQGRDELQSLVDDVLTPLLGHPPEKDDDGDIPIVTGTSLVFVRVVPDAPVVELFSCLVSGVDDRKRAAFEVAVLNRDVQFLKFVLAGDSIIASLHLPAWPFAPEHLRAMLILMSTTVDRLDDDLAVRLDGRRAYEPDDEDSTEPTPEPDETPPVATEDAATHPALMTLLQLEADAPGSVEPALAASICEDDRDLILRLITWNGEQEGDWRRARDKALVAGDPEGLADACDDEVLLAEQLVNLLRRALRIVVERELDQRSGSTAGRSPVGRRTGPRSGQRRVPDPTLDEVDPEMWS